MKKLVAILLCALLLAACNTGAPAGTATVASSPASAPASVGAPSTAPPASSAPTFTPEELAGVTAERLDAFIGACYIGYGEFGQFVEEINQPTLAQIAQAEAEESGMMASFYQFAIVGAAADTQLDMDDYYFLPETGSAALDCHIIPKEPVNTFAANWFGIDFAPIAKAAWDADMASHMQPYFEPYTQQAEAGYILPGSRGGFNYFVPSGGVLETVADGAITYTFDVTEQSLEGETPLGSYTLQLQLMREGEQVFPRFVILTQNS